MPITTKTGDRGLTGLFTGDRVAKFSPIMDANGTIDELDSFLGEAKHYVPEEMVEILEKIQVQLYDLMAELASKGKYQKVGEEEVKWLEELIKKYEGEFQMRAFVLPGSTIASAKLDICRAIARRAERRVAKLVLDYGFGNNALVYLNRLSDLLFIMARAIEKREGKLKEVK
ncbi:cob(I)yrinic acid a,c-diamide adenosyltransferase [Thermococcus thioreducens]|uniref:ATP:cob(I)alamin adenosyltransferase n=1 Tax=Thermococcus thioreducens TaxID=277988 RepID=A0A0Q2XPE2_9EURY|nr:cob(I)yrinic acid a,c-diamide adenosyltransferase [Thermococcus thioreducens]ASJ12426.1 cobalamin adenosyltransferase [Thermococcus thioreducens]KQH83156.1 cobalamin adenosyltransferase [Thermococcus thioreducens]SEV91063.1 ATP:cob(I)alamin adenosyltransferase [Thermococcus thioreducens]